jgi:citronellyl-CoA dehydrogenase
MRFTAEHDQFRKSLRDFIEREINPHTDEWEQAGVFPAHDLFRKLGDAGFLGLEYDPAFGGQGADHSYTVVFGEELGRITCGGVPMAIAVQTDMATPSLARHGTDELKKKYLVPACRGEVVGSIAVTEPDAGSDVASIRTRAVRDGDEWIINGTKLFITNGTQADWLCLLVRTSDEGGYRGMSQIVFPTDTPGFSVSRSLHKLGNRSSDTAELSFVDCRVPVANTIGKIGRGFHQQMQQFQNERMISCYTAWATARGALDRTIEYMGQRRAFGRPLADNQYLQYRIAELCADTEALRQLNHACAEAYIAGDDTTRLASICKLQAGRLVRRVADTCLQFHGGMGYMEETWTARFFRDTRLLSIGAGTDEVMLRVIAQLEDIGSVGG